MGDVEKKLVGEVGEDGAVGAGANSSPDVSWRGGEMQAVFASVTWGETEPKKNQKEAPRRGNTNEMEMREWGRRCSPWFAENGDGSLGLRRANTAAWGRLRV